MREIELGERLSPLNTAFDEVHAKLANPKSPRRGSPGAPIPLQIFSAVIGLLGLFNDHETAHIRK
jgi:hypothetical protein